MIDNKKLAKYLDKRIKEEYGNLEVPTKEDLEFWILQFRTRGCNGHSEWSERYQRNMWISDEEEC
jgi:hypothetical protein